MLKFSEISEFSKENFRKIPIVKEFEWFEWFEWFGPSPIEPFNSGSNHISNASTTSWEPRSAAICNVFRPWLSDAVMTSMA